MSARRCWWGGGGEGAARVHAGMGAVVAGALAAPLPPPTPHVDGTPVVVVATTAVTAAAVAMAALHSTAVGHSRRRAGQDGRDAGLGVRQGKATLCHKGGGHVGGQASKAPMSTSLEHRADRREAGVWNLRKGSSATSVNSSQIRRPNAHTSDLVVQFRPSGRHSGAAYRQGNADKTR